MTATHADWPCLMDPFRALSQSEEGGWVKPCPCCAPQTNSRRRSPRLWREPGSEAAKEGIGAARGEAEPGVVSAWCRAGWRRVDMLGWKRLLPLPTGYLSLIVSRLWGVL